MRRALYLPYSTVREVVSKPVAVFKGVGTVGVARSTASEWVRYIRALVLANRLDFIDLDVVLGQNWREVPRHTCRAASSALS